MKLNALFLYLVFSLFGMGLAGEIEKMSPRRMLELWKLEDNRSEIPLGFEDWSNAGEYKTELTSMKANGEKMKSTARVVEKIVEGKFIVYRVFFTPDAPVDIYGIYSYEKENDLYYKAAYVKGKQGTEADGFERFASFIGCRYPGTDIYSYTQLENNLPEKTLIIETQTKEQVEWREVMITNDGDFIQQNHGNAVPVRKKL